MLDQINEKLRRGENLTAEEMLALEQTPQALAARAEYDARNGRHDEIDEQRAAAKPAPGSLIHALEPRPTIVGTADARLVLPPVKAAHFALLQELDLPFYRFAFVDRTLTLKMRDYADAIFFFSQTPRQLREIIANGGVTELRRLCDEQILDEFTPGELIEMEVKLLEHIAAANSTRVDLAPEKEPAAEENPSVNPAKPSTVSAGSSNLSRA